MATEAEVNTAITKAFRAFYEVLEVVGVDTWALDTELSDSGIFDDLEAAVKECVKTEADPYPESEVYYGVR